MKTLVYEPDPLRARVYLARLGAEAGPIEIVDCLDQAEALLQTGAYERLALHSDVGAESARLTAIQKQTRPEMDVIDLAQWRGGMVRLG